LTAPGRIDTVDGQWRYDVTQNWLGGHGPVVTDSYLLGSGEQFVNPTTHRSYSFYNAAPSITPMPLMLFFRLLPGRNTARDQFAFTLAGPCIGALFGALLLLAYGWLGVPLRPSLLYTGIFGLGTLWWPASVTVFDQNQHAVLLFVSVLVAWQAGRARSPRLAGLAGLFGGLMLSYQESYAMLLPVAGLAVLAAPQEGRSDRESSLRGFLDRAALHRYIVFALGCGVGVGLFVTYNLIRFGVPLVLARYSAQNGPMPPTWGNGFAGLLSLAFSPGKGILWFSPPLLLAGLGARRLWARAPALAVTVAGVSIIHLLVVSHLTFFSGDRCWGPRYAIPLMPLWALAFPFSAARLSRPRIRSAGNRLLIPLAVAGLLVQVMGVSIEHERFFYERNLPGFFWATAPWFYFHNSQLIARPFEIAASLQAGPPEEARRFSPTPGPVTYCLYNPDDFGQSRRWMRQFQVFYLPRPWWGWIERIGAEERPVNPSWMMAACAMVSLLGVQAFRRSGIRALGTGKAKREPALVDPECLNA
jgi:hypothetical protein